MSNRTTSAKVLAISALIFAPIAGVAQTAPTIDGTVSISTTAIDVEGSNYRLNALNLVSDINFNDRFSIGLDLDNGRQSIGDDAINLKRFQIEPTWTFENGAYVGAYFQTASTDISFLSVTLDNVGFFGGYAQESWSVDAYFGETSTDLSIGKARNAGLTLSANPTQKLELFGHYGRAEVGDLLVGAGALYLSALGAEYTFDNGIMTYAAASTFEVASVDGPTSKSKHLAIGTGVQLSEIGLKAPGMLTLELAKTNFNFGAEQNQITLGWVFGIGKGNATPLNGIARTARGGIRGPFVGGIGTFGLIDFGPV